MNRLAKQDGIVGCMPWCKYMVIYRSVLLENLQYAANIAVGFFSYAIFIYTFIMLWGYMYRTPGELIAGYTKEQMIWYVMMTEMIWFGSSAASVAREVSTDIRGGNIAYLITDIIRCMFWRNIRVGGASGCPCMQCWRW